MNHFVRCSPKNSQSINKIFIFSKKNNWFDLIDIGMENYDLKLLILVLISL